MSSSSSTDDAKAQQLQKMRDGSRARREAGIKSQTLTERAGIAYNASNMRAHLAHQDQKPPTNARLVAETLAMQEVVIAALMHAAKDKDGVVTEAGIARACALHPHFEMVASQCVAVGHLDSSEWERMEQDKAERARRHEARRLQKEAASVAPGQQA